MINVSYSKNIVDKKVFGGKAYWLSWLVEHGYKVPECFFIEATSEAQLEQVVPTLKVNKEFNKKLNEFEVNKNKFGVAIRSSALNEDSAEESFAGHFKSFIGTFSYDQIFTNIENVIKSLKTDSETENQKMGVVIQRKVEARFSGVAFSSNPLTASKNELLISVVEGMGEPLVSGKTNGEDILVNCVLGKPVIPNFKTKIDNKFVIEICKIAKSIENKLNIPVDIEWCIDAASNELYILQCRPITSIFPKLTGIIPINISNKNLIPDQVTLNDKVKIRLIAQRNKIDVSNAYLVINPSSSLINEIVSEIKPEKRCKSYSVVLIHPKTVSGNIIRYFAKNEATKQRSAFRSCQRYDVRSYQNYNDLFKVLKLIQKKCNEESWLCIAIVQEVFEPKFTGIVQKIKDGFLIEIARGHFVPKGIATTSQYVLTSEGKIIFKNELIQNYSYNILNGLVSKDKVHGLVSLDKDTLKNIIKSLLPLLEVGGQAIEFGLLKNKSTKILSPYLIDLVDDSSKRQLNSKLISEGVLSMGSRTGKAVILDSKVFGKNSLELHFHNHLESGNSIDEEIIFITETPDIALLEVLKHHNNDKIGFVFKNGSVLSHFSIILREKGIPAIVISKGAKIKESEIISINAIKPGLKGIERLVRGL